MNEKRYNQWLVKRDREQSARRQLFLQGALSMPEGREFLYWLLSITSLRANPYTRNALDTAFNCGQMNVGQRIEEAIITASPDFYLTMLKEQENARQEVERRANEARDEAGSDSGERPEQSGREAGWESA